MSRLAAHLDAISLWLAGLMHEGAPLVTECRRQLDLVDAEDVVTISFQSPCGFLVLPRARLRPRADGGKDIEIEIALLVASRSRPGAAADVDVLDRALALTVALEDADFGQTKTTAPAEIEFRPVLQAGLESKGVSIAAVSFRQLLLQFADPPAATMGLVDEVGTGDPRPGDPASYVIADGQPTPEEQAIIDGWA